MSKFVVWTLQECLENEAVYRKEHDIAHCAMWIHNELCEVAKLVLRTAFYPKRTFSETRVLMRRWEAIKEIHLQDWLIKHRVTTEDMNDTGSDYYDLRSRYWHNYRQKINHVFMLGS